MLRIINIIATLIFAAFAWLQYNDDNPDIYVEPSIIDAGSWILFYSLVAVGFLAAAFRKYPKWLYVIAGAFALYYMATTAPGLIDNIQGDHFEMTKGAMNPEHPQVETTREFLGALIAFLSLSFLWLQATKSGISKHA